MDTYRKQLEIIEKVVEHLDGDSEQHSVEVKNARFEVLLDLLQRVSECSLYSRNECSLYSGSE